MACRLELWLVAFGYAKAAHDGVTRDFSGEPYFEHVRRVAQTLVDLDFPEESIIAALLHDVLEDTDITETEILELFGQEVLNLVKDLSEPAKLRAKKGVPLPPKPERKAEFIREMANISLAAKNIKLSDIIDNTTDFVKYYEMNTPRAERFLFAKRKMLVMLREGTSKILYDRADKALNELEAKVAP